MTCHTSEDLPVEDLGSYPALWCSKCKLFLCTISAFYQKKTSVVVGSSLVLQERIFGDTLVGEF